LRYVKGAWVKGHKVVAEDGNVAEYRVMIKVAFVLDD